jgi:ubiquinone/menaquinone biosynthesis C-methylase UbiE
MDEAEFDRFADEYYSLHAKNIAVTGEAPDFFSEYKIAALAEHAHARGIALHKIVDFGSGIGNSIPWFRQFFPGAAVVCADVSPRSMELARTRYPGDEAHLLVERDRVPLPDASQDAVFSACVFHHIPHAEHPLWLQECYRICRPGGLLTVFEHNPMNPLTVRAVNTCPFDVNAHLVSANRLRGRIMDAGWRNVEVQYCIFFPRALARLRVLERYMRKVMFGAQYCVVATR